MTEYCLGISYLGLLLFFFLLLLLLFLLLFFLVRRYQRILVHIHPRIPRVSLNSRLPQGQLVERKEFLWAKVYNNLEQESPLVLTLNEPVPEAFPCPAFTLSRSSCKLSPMKVLSSRTNCSSGSPRITNIKSEWNHFTYLHTLPGKLLIKNHYQRSYKPAFRRTIKVPLDPRKRHYESSILGKPEQSEFQGNFCAPSLLVVRVKSEPESGSVSVLFSFSSFSLCFFFVFIKGKRMAQLVEHREVAGSNPGRTNTQDL